MYRLASAVLVLSIAAGSAPADALKISSAAPKFSGLECATAGKSCSLADFQDKDVIVMCITCNHCPVAKAYEDRLIAFAKKYGADSKVALVAFSVNTGEDDSLPKMRERAKEKGFNFPYLYDGSQKIARDLGATCTPEFFVFNKERRLVYTGTMDDNMKADKVSKRYVEEAVQAALKGETPKTEKTAPQGCGIRYSKSGAN
jgi:peroxiredoxin